LRRGRHSGAPWLWAALGLDITMTVAERLDNEIYSATGMLVSGHNVKHLLAGVLLGCTLAWLLLARADLAFRRPASAVLVPESEFARQFAAMPGGASNRLLQRHGHRLLSLPETSLQI
ncbi:MAG TPA: hypothetical protein VN989_10145, partial [Casimicrobiaceae bacterium]|nr:hypothetical protein [Casimicrobiaceae bacterium]